MQGKVYIKRECMDAVIQQQYERTFRKPSISELSQIWEVISIQEDSFFNFDGAFSQEWKICDLHCNGKLIFGVKEEHLISIDEIRDKKIQQIIN